ncbi:MAG: hypothetical protein KGI13_09395 [Betaproteobacteria bacterium]|nr:hypothetical protein [Betaproteobacteria bacterium]
MQWIIDLAKFNYGPYFAQFLLFVVFAYIARHYFPLWVAEQMKLQTQKDHTKFSEALKWELKGREQAVKVAEYLALANTLKSCSSEEEYRKANQLSWELAMWLPEDIYKKMVQGVVNRNLDSNELVTVVQVRKLLLGDDSGNLTVDDVAVHGPSIGGQ